MEFGRGDILWIQCDPSVGVEPQKLVGWAKAQALPNLLSAIAGAL